MTQPNALFLARFGGEKTSMNEWYVLLAFVAGVVVGQHLTIRAIERADGVGVNDD